MDIFMIVMRILHIGGAMAWVGAGVLLAFFVMPAVARLNTEEGASFLRSFLLQTPVEMFLPIAAFVTIASGFAMYMKTMDYMAKDQLMVLNIGVVAGLLAFGHGATAMTSRTNKLKKAVEGNTSDISEAIAKYRLNVQITFWLSFVALLAMASARYF